VRLVLLGPPGSGKGTQGGRLASDLGIPQVSTGDILRAAVAAGTDLGNAAHRFLDAGELVPDDVMLGLIEERIRDDDCGPGFILDGFPRTLAQAEGLDVSLVRLEKTLDRAVLFEVSRERLVERLVARRVCWDCGRVFNTETTPASNVCPGCGGPVKRRGDDAAPTIERRLKIYAGQSAPLAEYYAARSLLVRVPGEGTIAEVHGRVRAALGLDRGR
jgi:adenylate kinase